MSLNRLLYVLIGLALVIVAGLAIRTSIATSAVAATAHDSYDELERIRASRDPVKTADFSYDEVERNRSQFLITRTARPTFRTMRSGIRTRSFR